MSYHSEVKNQLTRCCDLIYFLGNSDDPVSRQQLATRAIWFGCFVAVIFFISTYRTNLNTLKDQSLSVAVVNTKGKKGHDGIIKFVVKPCEVGPKSVWCNLLVSSLKYDRLLLVPRTGLVMTDKGGNAFRGFAKTLETKLVSNQEAPLRVGFLLDKDLLPPAKVTLSGYVDDLPIWTTFDVN